MTDSNTHATPRRTQSARLAEIQKNLEVIRSAICSQALLCRFDSESSERLHDIASEIENISDEIGCVS